MVRSPLTVDGCVRGVLEGDRTVIGRTLTLVESRLPSDEVMAGDVLARLWQETGRAHRIGVTGVPGVGKSTLIGTLGCRLLEQGHRPAVLAVDPSSELSGGSILGDKTRMGELAKSPSAFIRPTPAGGSQGGVARATRQAMWVLEAAGYDVVFVETVGTGQSDTAVASMVDTFLLLLLPGGGDELQGIKRGVLELADVLAVNKADGEAEASARQTAAAYKSALSLLRRGDLETPVLTLSAQNDQGVDALWLELAGHRQRLVVSGELDMRRQRQRVDWMRTLVRERLLSVLEGQELHPVVEELEGQVASGQETPRRAADRLLAAYHELLLKRRDA